MATPEDIALSTKLMSFVNTLGNGDTNVRNALNKLVGSQSDLLAIYIKQLDDTRKWDTDLGRLAKERLIELKRQALEEERVKQEYITQVKKSNNELTNLEKEKSAAQKKAAILTSQADKFKAAQADVYGTISKEMMDAEIARLAQLDEVAAQIAKIDISIKNESQLRGAIVKGFADDVKRLDAVGKEREALEKQQMKLTTQVGQLMWQGAVDGLKKQFADKGIVDSVTEGWNTVVAGAATQMGMTIGNVFDAASLGFKPTEFIKLQNEFRRTEMSMIGGQQTFIKGLQDGEKAYSDMIIDPAERSKAIAEQFQILTNSGIRPTTKTAGEFSDTLHKVAHLTGKNASEINADLASMADAESTQTLLKVAASEEERNAILAGTRAVYANNIALGMSAKQATAAATALTQIHAQGAKSRITEAARTRVLGAALGMGGAGNELAALTMIKKPNAAQQKREDELRMQMSAEVGRRQGNGLTSELGINALTEGLKLDERFGPDSPFNNALGIATAATKDNTNAIVGLPKWLTTAMSDGAKAYATIMKNPVITGPIGFLTALLPTNYLLGIIAKNTGGLPGKGMFDKFLGKGGKAAGGIAEGAEIAATKSAKAAEGASKLAPALAESAGVLSKGLKILGPIGAGAAGIYEGYSKYQETGKKGEAIGTGTGAVAGTLIGGAIGTLAGPIGTIAGAAIGDWIGEKAGGAIGGLFDTDNAAKKTDTTADINEPTKAADAAKTLNDQLNKMDKTNELLKAISENSATSAEFAEKLVAVMTMNEKDRTDSKRRSDLMGDNRFISKNFGNAM